MTVLEELWGHGPGTALWTVCSVELAAPPPIWPRPSCGSPLPTFSRPRTSRPGPTLPSAGGAVCSHGKPTPSPIASLLLRLNRTLRKRFKESFKTTSKPHYTPSPTPCYPVPRTSRTLSQLTGTEALPGGCHPTFTCPRGSRWKGVSRLVGCPTETPRRRPDGALPCPTPSASAGGADQQVCGDRARPSGAFSPGPGIPELLGPAHGHSSGAGGEA